MCENYERLVADSQRILRQLNPNRPEDSGNICPMTADAVDNYLRTGRPVRVPDDLVTEYSIVANWQQRSLPNIVAGLRRDRKHCTHVVVRGHRPRSSQFAPTHFFVMMKVGGDVYIVDAWLHLISRDFNHYADSQQFNRFFVTTEFEASVPLL